MIAFVWVIAMIPGLLIGLQAYTIDYDAVAYRTGVILVEDPGYPAYSDATIPGWENQQNFSVKRFGLAISKENRNILSERDTPNILSEEKVNRFFNTTDFIYPEDYREKVIFGDYPYRFNISIRDLDRNKTQSVGDVLPLESSYGYIRRLVYIKETSNATLSELVYKNPPAGIRYNNTENVSTHTFSILLNTTRLVSDEVTDPAYQINPVREPIVINLTDLDTTINQPFPVKINLTNVRIRRVGDPITYPFLDSLYIDDSGSPQLSLPVDVTSRVMLKFRSTFFDKAMTNAAGSRIFINLTFKLTKTTDPGERNVSRFLNNTPGVPFEYTYTQKNVRLPQLHPAILEVAVW
jgi:hypothetical protein